MKTPVLVLLVVFSACISFKTAWAQQFAPVGAVWYYGANSIGNSIPYYKIEAIKDTVLHGKDCRVLKRVDVPSCYYPPTRIYVYEEDSVTYFYNDSLNDFQILYDLKTKKDSSWTTISYWAKRDTVIVKVDSVYWQAINGHNLKTLDVSFYVPGNPSSQNTSTIVEQIGDMLYLLNLPEYYIPCDGHFPEGLRCYEDSVIGSYNTGIATTCIDSLVSSYYPFPVGDAIWNVRNLISEGGPFAYRYQYDMHGDTVVNNRHYSIITEETYGVYGGIREDASKKVYYKSFSGNYDLCFGSALLDTLDEIILYDFGLEVGDTSFFFDSLLFPQNNECYEPRILLEIDSVLVFGEYRKRYHIGGGPMLSDDYWIEGVGSELGLFGAYAGEFENDWALCSFEQTGQTWLIPEFLCSVGIHERNQTSVSIFPNPTSGKIEIASPLQNIKTIELLDINGSIAATFTEVQAITLKDMQQGVYFLKITDTANRFYFGKVMKM